MNEWADLLPEKWRRQLHITLLKVGRPDPPTSVPLLNSNQEQYSHITNDHIHFNVRGGQFSEKKDQQTSGASGKTARQWHEKFGNTRR